MTCKSCLGIALTLICMIAQNAGDDQTNQIEFEGREKYLRRMMTRISMLATNAVDRPNEDECLACRSTSNCCGECACIHGYCDLNQTCICHGDWFGDSCDFHILSDSFYAPSNDPKIRTAKRIEQAYKFTQKLSDLTMDFDRLQHHRSSEDKILSVRMESRGLGSWVHHMQGAMSWAFASNSTLVLRHPYDYFLHDGYVSPFLLQNT
eukprot:759537-Hanusia_phi.AAC.1